MSTPHREFNEEVINEMAVAASMYFVTHPESPNLPHDITQDVIMDHLDKVVDLVEEAKTNGASNEARISLAAAAFFLSRTYKVLD